VIRVGWRAWCPVLVATCAFTVAACSGSGGGNGSLSAGPSGGAGRLQISLAVPARDAQGQRAPTYISPGIQSLGVAVGSGTLTSVPCTPPPSGTATCTLTVNAPVGTATVTVETFAVSSPGPTASASMLSFANATIAVAPAVLNTPTIVTAPVVHNVTVALANPFPIQGGSSSTTLSVTGALDAAGHAIPGPLSSVAPITFASSSNVVSVAPATTTDLTKTIAVNYTGGSSAPVTISLVSLAGTAGTATLSPDYFLIAPFPADASGDVDIGLLDRYRPSIFNVEALGGGATTPVTAVAADRAGSVAFVAESSGIAQIAVANGIPGAVTFTNAAPFALLATNGTQFFANVGSALGTLSRGPVFTPFFTSTDCSGTVTAIATDASGSAVYYVGQCAQVFAATTGGVRTASAVNPDGAAYTTLGWFSNGGRGFLLAADVSNNALDVFALPLNGSGPVGHLVVPVTTIFGASFVLISPDQSTAAVGDDVGPIFGDPALYLIDLTNPSAPTIRGRVPPQPFGGYATGAYSGGGDAIYTTECSLEAVGVVTNLTAPVPTATTLGFPPPFDSTEPCAVTVSPQSKLRRLQSLRMRRSR
jgi:hypothetical protein